jgi:hypothetical protein
MNIVIISKPRTFSYFLPIHISLKLCRHLFFSTLGHMLPRLWLNHPRRKAQIVKLVIMQCFPLLLPLRTSQHLSNSSLGRAGRDFGVSDRIIQYRSVRICCPSPSVLCASVLFYEFVSLAPVALQAPWWMVVVARRSS